MRHSTYPRNVVARKRSNNPDKLKDGNSIPEIYASVACGAALPFAQERLFSCKVLTNAGAQPDNKEAEMMAGSQSVVDTMRDIVTDYKRMKLSADTAIF